MSEQSDPYVLGGTQTEQQRLLAQASEFEIQSRWLLDQIDVRPGWRAVDIGCGPIDILNLLSERVGIEGSVVGLEREERFVAMARSEIARRGLRNVEIVQADALNTGFAKNRVRSCPRTTGDDQRPEPQGPFAGNDIAVAPGWNNCSSRR